MYNYVLYNKEEAYRLFFVYTFYILHINSVASDFTIPHGEILKK